MDRRAKLLADCIEEGAAGPASFADGLSEEGWCALVSGKENCPVGVIARSVFEVRAPRCSWRYFEPMSASLGQ